MSWLDPEGVCMPLPSKPTMMSGAGAVFRHAVAGGGDWGDPLERYPEVVSMEVRNGKVGHAAAECGYA
jgi:N-methylhydantoinase B/oxoprolinase/acetone carboxylase alpha subunit